MEGMKILITTDWYKPVINGVVTSVVTLKEQLEMCIRDSPIPAGHRVLKERQRGRKEGQQEEKQDEQNQYGKE